MLFRSHFFLVSQSLSFSLQQRHLSSFKMSDFLKTLKTRFGSRSAGEAPPEMTLVDGVVAVSAVKRSLKREYCSLDPAEDPNATRMNCFVLEEARHFKRKDSVAHEYIVAQFTHATSRQKYYVRVEFFGGHPEEASRVETLETKSSSSSSSYPSMAIAGKGEGNSFFSKALSFPGDTVIRKEVFQTTGNICTLMDLAILADVVHTAVKDHAGGDLSRPCFWLCTTVMHILSTLYETNASKSASRSGTSAADGQVGTAGAAVPANPDVNTLLGERTQTGWKYVDVQALKNSFATSCKIGRAHV